MEFLFLEEVPASHLPFQVELLVVLLIRSPALALDLKAEF